MLRQLVATTRQIAQEKHNSTITLWPDNIVFEGRQVETISFLADNLQASDVPVSVRAVAARDHVEGDTEITVRLLPLEVRTAFQSGEVLAQDSIDGRQSDAQIFNQLQKLVDAGRRAAEGGGVTPAFTVESLSFFANGTNERIFEALRKIQATKRLVTVRMVAAKQLSTVDAPQVRFEIGDEKV